MSVPEFLSSGTNYFTVDLDAKGNVRIDYGATNRSDGIVGVSPGGGAVDPGPTDLSRAPALSVAGTTYQTFGGSFAAFGGVDLYPVQRIPALFGSRDGVTQDRAWPAGHARCLESPSYRPRGSQNQGIEETCGENWLLGLDSHARRGAARVLS